MIQIEYGMQNIIKNLDEARSQVPSTKDKLLYNLISMQNLHMELLKSLNRDYDFDKRNIDKKLSF